MTDEERKDAENAFEDVQEAQTVYWEALSQLEALTGLELDSSRDFEGLTLEDLEEDEEEEEEDETVTP